MSIPHNSDFHHGLLAEVHAIHDDYPMWNRRVGVYLRPVGETFEVVGIERESDPPDAVM